MPLEQELCVFCSICFPGTQKQYNYNVLNKSPLKVLKELAAWREERMEAQLE